MIDEDQAAIVREVFERYAKGDGLRKICKSLSERGISSPRAGKRGIGAWAPSAVHAMLRRSLYIGRMEWGHVHKTYKSGTRAHEPAQARACRVDAPHLRIISDELWNAVQARVNSQKAPEKKGGRPAFYLLSGVLRCGECNGPLTVIRGKHGNKSIRVYACARRRDRGGTVCPSTLRREVGALDGLVLNWVRDNVLTEEYVTEVISEARRRIEARSSTRAAENEPLERLAKKLRTEVDKFAEMALEAPLSTRAVFFAKVSERQKQLADVESRMWAAGVTSAATNGVFDETEREVREQLGKPRDLVASYPAEMRAVVRGAFPDGLCARLSAVVGRGQTVEVSGD